MNHQLRILYACLAILGITSLNASEGTIQPKTGSITNKSDEKLIDIFFYKSPAGAANILRAHGWSQKSLTLLANTTTIAQSFVPEAATINLGIGFLSDFVTDAISAIVAAITTTREFPYVAKGATIRWESQALKTKAQNPYLESMSCIIFAYQPDLTTNFNRILFLGPIDISTNYEFYLGKMVNKDTGEISSEFAPIEKTKSETLKKLTATSPEEVSAQLKKIVKEHQEWQAEKTKKAQQEAEKLKSEKYEKQLKELKTSQVETSSSAIEHQ